LAGGAGSRMGLSTKVTNKHLLCVYNMPMIMYPLRTLKSMGIKEILIVSSREHVGDMIELLGSGSDFGFGFTYRVQDEFDGIAGALCLAESFIGNDFFATILGDNYFEQDINIGDIERREAKIFLTRANDPKRFGVVEIKGKQVINIIEKPDKPKSNLIATGIYIYDKNVFSTIKKLKKSDRNEYEITDVHNEYIKRGLLRYSMINGFWSDMGAPESLLKTAAFIGGEE